MVKYQDSKIYKIVLDDCDEVYVGSTTRALCARMAGHRANAKTTNASHVHRFINEYGWDKAHIILIENYPCQSKEELKKKEREWIEQIGTLNRRIPLRDWKEYYDIHKEEKRQYYKEWSERNHERLKAYSIEYRERNKDELYEKKKQYYLENADKINERRREARKKKSG